MQVISTELNRAVVELLQQLLFWQERAKATSPYNVNKRKRLVSGLRYAPAVAPHHLCAWACLDLCRLCLGTPAGVHDYAVCMQPLLAACLRVPNPHAASKTSSTAKSWSSQLPFVLAASDKLLH